MNQVMKFIFRRLSYIRYSLCAAVLLSAAGNCLAQLYPHEGYVDVKGGKIWYRIIGGGNKTPLLLLHGGPGSTSYYLNPLKELSKDRPVIYFDQLGCGRSTHITDTSLMTINNYVDEIEQLKNTLGIKEYYLYGHSWGTMLGIDYYLKYPEGIKAIIFGSPLFSTDLWIKDADTLIQTLPDSIQQIINDSRKNNNYSSSEYQEANQAYSQNFTVRTNNYPADVDSTMKTSGSNVYQYMWGPSEWEATGTLKNYNRIADLHKINIPVLLTAGEYDEARPSTVKYYESLIPNCKFIIIKNAGHVTMMDNTNDNNAAIADFLNSIDKQ
jgi:proline iminopeptidase